MSGILSTGGGMAAAFISGALLYLAAPRQRVLPRPLPALPAAMIAATLLALGAWCTAAALGPVSAFFATLANWMLALICAPWLAAWHARGRRHHGA